MTVRTPHKTRAVRAFVAAAAAVALLPATAHAYMTLTPAGPGTLIGDLRPSEPCDTGPGMPVLVGWGVEVGAGGKAGVIRPKFRDVLGDPVQLPAEPGYYRFPAPPMRWPGLCMGSIGVIQTTGEHAILSARIRHWSRHTVISREGQPDERIDHAALEIVPFTEADADGDMLGDTTQDRTDLQLSAAPERRSDGRLQVALTVTNRGPLAADRPEFGPGPAGAMWTGCRGTRADWRPSPCLLPRIAPGASATVTLTADAPGEFAAVLEVFGDGPDLTRPDNTVHLAVPAPPAFEVVVANKQRLTQGIKVRVRAVRAGRARVTAAFEVRGRTVKVAKLVALEPFTSRTVTLRAKGAKLRSLKRAAARGTLTARVTVRTIRGKAPVTATTTVRP